MDRCHFLWVVLLVLTQGCLPEKAVRVSQPLRLSLFDIYEIPHQATFHRTMVGGLSGIDYNRKEDLFYIISDDPSLIHPARFYTARLFFHAKGIEEFRLLQVDTLFQAGRIPFPSTRENRKLAYDPESIRFDAKRNQLVWTSEGERIIRGDSVILQDPMIQVMDRNGVSKRRFIIPENVRSRAEESGPRHNSSFEGFCFSGDYRYAYVSLESPLIQDGLPAATGDSSGTIRIIKYEVASGKPLAQYPYTIDPVKHTPDPPGGFKINGVTEILWVGKDKLLVVERSYSTGIESNSVRIYLTDLSTANDVRDVPSLGKARVIPSSKQLVLDLDTLGRVVDNVEGICLGPRLPNGKSSLVLITDNNFSPNQKTQLMVFQID